MWDQVVEQDILGVVDPIMSLLHRRGWWQSAEERRRRLIQRGEQGIWQMVVPRQVELFEPMEEAVQPVKGIPPAPAALPHRPRRSS